MALCVVGAAFLLVGPPPMRPAAAGPPPPGARPTEAPGDSPELTIDPASGWLESGETEPLAAEWVGGPPGCALVPIWYRWSIDSGGAEGTVAPTNGSGANFTAVGIESGTTVVALTSAADVVCGENRSAVTGSAHTTLEVDAPISVVGFHTVLGVASRNGSLAVAGAIAGGRPPYSLAVAWGTGAVTDARRPAGGNFTIWGRPGNGSVDPHLLISDAAGIEARAIAEENGTGAGGFGVAIDPSGYTAEVGIPLSYRIDSTVPSTTFSYVSVCESVDPASARPEVGGPLGFSCTFGTAGTGEISVVATTNAPPFSVATAELRLPVEPPLTMTPDGNVTVAEVGRLAFVPVTLRGGVPPIRLDGRLLGNGSASVLSVPTDGTVLVPVEPAAPGQERLDLSAVDALGIPAENASAPLTVVAPLNASAAVRASVGTNDSIATVRGEATGGASPYDWAVVASGNWTRVDPDGGGAPVGSPFAWNASADREGPVNVSVEFVDALGAERTVPLTAEAVAALNVTAAGRVDGPGRFAVEVRIGGGVPPFAIRIRAPDGDSWNRSSAPARSWNLTGTDRSGGPIDLDVEVTDRLGVVARASAEIPAGPAASVSAGVGSADVVAGLAIIGAVGVGLFVWRRRAVPAPVAAPIDAVGILRGIISPADGADRTTVELLAEEQGVPLDDVRVALDRLIADGTVRAERGSDGEEILAWRFDR